MFWVIILKVIEVNVQYSQLLHKKERWTINWIWNHRLYLKLLHLCNWLTDRGLCGFLMQWKHLFYLKETNPFKHYHYGEKCMLYMVMVNVTHPSIHLFSEPLILTKLGAVLDSIPAVIGARGVGHPEVVDNTQFVFYNTVFTILLSKVL